MIGRAVIQPQLRNDDENGDGGRHDRQPSRAYRVRAEKTDGNQRVRVPDQDQQSANRANHHIALPPGITCVETLQKGAHSANEKAWLHALSNVA